MGIWEKGIQEKSLPLEQSLGMGFKENFGMGEEKDLDWELGKIMGIWEKGMQEKSLPSEQGPGMGPRKILGWEKRDFRLE